MFITAPGLVQHLHPSQVAPRQSRWPAITLSMERPWCLLVYDVSYNGQKVSQTSLVAWDNTLLDMLAEIPVVDLKGIARLDRHRDSGPSWSFNWIDALWTPAPCEASSVGTLLFKLSDDPHIRNGRLQPVPGAPGRRLLIRHLSGGQAQMNGICPAVDGTRQLRAGFHSAHPCGLQRRH